MKKLLVCILITLVLFTGCSEQQAQAPQTAQNKTNEIQIELSDNDIMVDGKEISKQKDSAVYAANDIIFYLEGQDFTYGEGTNDDAHKQSEADKHTVVHITKPGKYILSGKLSAGQIAVDLGDNAKKDPNAVVTLVLNSVDITCSVAPAVIFYNVYECGNDDENSATKDVDTSKAGANVIICDNSTNNINGSYVARIYDPETIVLNETGTEVEDADKLHKYDGAFYSKRTMNILGEEKGNGILNINAENEGLDSELHLTINGGIININSGNDGINTNEDNVSVTTVNGGAVNIICNGKTGEGDGIDSNGWLVINGGTVNSQACATSGDAGIDSDKGIYINGGTVIATGNMLDRIAGGNQTYAVFTFATRQKGDNTYILKSSDGKSVGEYSPQNDFTYLIIAADNLNEGEYTFWQDNVQLAAVKSSGNMGGGPQKPQDFTNIPNGFRPDMSKPWEDMQEFENQLDSNGNPIFKPENAPEMPNGERPNRPQKPDGEHHQMPNGEMPDDFPGTMPPDITMNVQGELSTTFAITKGANQFANVSPAQTEMSEE